MKTKHKHAESMLAYAQDAQETDTPWMLWEYTSPNSNGWRPLKDNPSWHYTLEYRRKVKTIRIGKYDVPEPLRVAPEIGEGYYYYVNCCSFPNFRHSIFADDDFDYRIFVQGMMHLTEEAAELKGAMQAQDAPTQPITPTLDADGWVENTGAMPECKISN